MSTASIAIFVIVTVMMGAIIAIPFLLSLRSKEETDPEHQARELEEQVLQLVQAVQDLDADYDMNKIANPDYIAQRKVLIGRGVSTLIRLDQAQAELKVQDRELEALIANYRQQHS